MELYTKSRDGKLYNAKATFENGIVTVKKGSQINMNDASGFIPRKGVSGLRSDESLFVEGNILATDVQFNSLSTAATFVTGRIANGMIVWKTENGKYVKYSISNRSE